LGQSAFHQGNLRSAPRLDLRFPQLRSDGSGLRGFSSLSHEMRLVGTFCLGENIASRDAGRDETDEVPAQRKQRRGHHDREGCGHHQETVRDLPGPKCREAGANQKPPPSRIRRGRHPLVVTPRSEGSSKPFHGRDTHRALMNRRFRPTVHEGGPCARSTCNDDGLCRMLFFSDD